MLKSNFSDEAEQHHFPETAPIHISDKMLIHNIMLIILLCTKFPIFNNYNGIHFSSSHLFENLLVQTKHRLLYVPNFVREPFENSQHIDGFYNELNFRYLFYYSAIVFADDYRGMPARNL